MREESTRPAIKSPERILDEAVERNEQSIRRIQLRIRDLKAALSQLEHLQSNVSEEEGAEGQHRGSR